jgi:hypothetical protein
MNTFTRKNPRAGQGVRAFRNTQNEHPHSVSYPRRLQAKQPLDRSALDAAKQAVTISTAWRALGLTGEPSRTCCSPFREERHASFSISPDGLLWHDFTTGEGGDVVSFVTRATACNDAEAIRRVLDLAGGNASPFALAPRHGPAKHTAAPYDGLARLDLQPLTLAEVHALRDLRGFAFSAGLELANRRGLLRCADVSHRGQASRAWILTDDARRSAQARRLDGEPWASEAGHSFKSKSLRTDPDAPAGLADVVNANRPAVLICEGEGDTLAALTFAWLADVADKVGVVCLTGTSKGIPPAVCAALVGRRVRILRQADKSRPDGTRPSHRAALVWAESLHAAGITCDVANLDGLTRADGTPAKDVADLLTRPADLETLQPIAAALCAGLSK